MKRRMYALLLSCAIAATLGACGGDTNTSSQSESASTASAIVTPEATFTSR